jgi:hypothetical protein
MPSLPASVLEGPVGGCSFQQSYCPDLRTPARFLVDRTPFVVVVFFFCEIGFPDRKATIKPCNIRLLVLPCFIVRDRGRHAEFFVDGLAAPSVLVFTLVCVV